MSETPLLVINKNESEDLVIYRNKELDVCIQVLDKWAVATVQINKSDAKEIVQTLVNSFGPDIIDVDLNKEPPTR